MRPATVPLDTAYQGDPWSITFKFWTDSTKTTPLDLTGRAYTGYVQLADLTEVAFDTTGTVLVDGELVLALTAEQTTLLEPTCVYFIMETIGADPEHTLIKGRFFTEAREAI